MNILPQQDARQLWRSLGMRLTRRDSHHFWYTLVIPSVWKMGTEGRESKVIFSELKASLGYIGICLKNNNNNKRMEEVS